MKPTTLLFHGTLLANVPSISVEGLSPQVGKFTRAFYGDESPGLIPAVFMTDSENLERAVHAMVAAVIEQITDEDHDRYEICSECHLNDDLFFEYAALLEIACDPSFQQVSDAEADGHAPIQAEPGDWYSLRQVHPVRSIHGKELRHLLAERGMTPSEINDFVDDRSILRQSLSVDRGNRSGIGCCR